jgi:hypothetical protein
MAPCGFALRPGPPREAPVWWNEHAARERDIISPARDHPAPARDAP